jgi:chromosome partitioning protein
MFAWMLGRLTSQYDFIIIDCSPSFGMLTINALVASDFVLMPLQAEFLPLLSVNGFMHHIKSLKKLNKRLEFMGFVLTRYDHRKIMNRDVYQKLKDEFKEKVFATCIRNNIQLAKAQEAGTDIFQYDRRSHGATDYEELATELLLRIGKQHGDTYEQAPAMQPNF